MQQPTVIHVGSAIDASRWSGYQKLVLVYAALAFAMDGLANQVLGLAIPVLIADWHVPRDAFALVAAMGLTGVAIGAAAGGMLGDAIGRRWGLIVSVLLFGLMTAASAGAHDVTTLALLRALDGIGIGGAIPNGTALIAESTPAHRRSRAIALGMVFIPIGGLLAGGIATAALPTLGWRVLFLIAGGLSVALAVLFVFILPESPRFLARFPQSHAQLAALLRRYGQSSATHARFVDETPEQGRTPILALFGAPMRRDTIALWAAFFFCLLTSYSVFSWAPTMLAGEGFDVRSASLGISAFAFGGMLGGVLGGLAIERFGSRFALVGFASGVIAAALVLIAMLAGPNTSSLAVTAGLAAHGLFAAGLLNALYTLSAYLYPPFARSTGVGAAAGIGRIGAVASSFTGIASLNVGGATGFFSFLILCTMITLFAIAMMRRQIPGVTSARGVVDSPLNTP